MSTKIESHPYFKQATLLLEVIPAVAMEDCFALKGGTAINFFVRDMPRLSVDIDLTYLPIEDRATSLTKINDALKRVAGRVQKAIPKATIQEAFVKSTQIVTKLYVSANETQIIIEPNLTLRGTVFGSIKMKISKQVADQFGSSASIAVVSSADLYGGKICAALDRQHPRDLYDVKLLLENEGITDEIRKGFIVYLCGHDATMSQLLMPPRKNIAEIYERQFVGMPIKPVSLQELLRARELLIEKLMRGFTDTEKQFLISFKAGVPDFNLLGIGGVEKLPAIQWKLANIKKMKPEHHQRSLERLKRIFDSCQPA